MSLAGEWLVSLGLAEPSSPTWVDARLFIVDLPSIGFSPTKSIDAGSFIRGLLGGSVESCGCVSCAYVALNN
jgi:hypothetical protein